MESVESESKRLLVVDDEAAILKLLKTLLTRANYRVAGCESGAEALKLLSQGQYDLMITDAIMPAMSGFDLVRAVRNNSSFGQLPILMLTRKNDRSDVKRALEAGVTDYVIKPIDEHLLIDKVAVSLKSREPESRLRGVTIHGEASVASATIDARIISVRETGIMIRFPIQLSGGTPLRLSAPVFDEIGIKPPILRLVSCELRPSGNPPGETDPFRDFPCEAEFSFVGLSEPELRKIRTWLQKQEIQRRK